ncbi:hypothetical protein [Methylomonas sp. ZR1]|uniref:hypothetical protein n=1 Tax=Methylomonas sp. ZR1 TaxID=1797072 RepID=UPI001490A229|nr:hypothetical protein [Methylomonas sp. ZR1]NOV32722.1 hypothetical protein [Methylomonas sp. ZR1]
MKYLDDLIVALATYILRGVLAVGAGAVYAQFLALLFLASMFGTVSFSVLLVAAFNALSGV